MFASSRHFSGIYYKFAIVFIASKIIQPIRCESVIGVEKLIFRCHGVVCDYSRLYKKDKTFLVTEINNFRNRVAGGVVKNYPFCVANVNKVKWNQTIAIEAQHYVETCPKYVWYQLMKSPSNLPAPSKHRPPIYTRSFEYDHPDIRLNRKCDVTTLTVYGSRRDFDDSYAKIKQQTLDLVRTGQMDDFWNVDRKGSYDIIFRRAEVTEFGCGYMLRDINETSADQQLLSYIVCIYCDFDMKKPVLKKYPCPGCKGNHQKRQAKLDKNFLCQDNVDAYTDIPDDVTRLKMECITGEPLYETIIPYTDDGYTGTEDAATSSTDDGGGAISTGDGGGAISTDDGGNKDCTTPNCPTPDCSSSSSKRKRRRRLSGKSVTLAMDVLVLPTMAPSTILSDY